MPVTSLPPEFRLTGVVDERYDEWLDVFLGAFGHVLDEEGYVAAQFRTTMPPERVIAVADDAGYVGTAAAVDVDLVLPGGRSLAMAAVTGVAVRPTATRRGLLRAMMTHLHRRAVDEGRALAGLGASEWPIYGRFGYGPASWFDSVTVDVRGVCWRDDAPGGTAPLRPVRGKEARELAIDLSRRQGSETPGDVVPVPGYWDRFTASPAAAGRLDAIYTFADDTSARREFVAVDDRGLLRYCLRRNPASGRVANDLLQITDLIAADTEAMATLWRHALAIDLVSMVKAPRVAIDDPLRWWVADAHRILRDRHDGVWLRPLDVTTLLEARSWSGDGALTLAVHDQEGYATGTYRLEVDAGRGSCQPSTAEPDLEMDVSALGAIFLGGTAATELALAGRIRACDPRTTRLWDTLATTDRSPMLHAPF